MFRGNPDDCMIISIHQPHFLPWLGYFNKVFNSDTFVWLHNVQYRKNYFQSRTRIKNPHNGEPYWLTVPVHAPFGIQIDQVHQANDRWVSGMVKTIDQFYKKSQHYNSIAPDLLNIISSGETNLDFLNFKLFQFLLVKLEYRGKVIRVEELLPLSEEPNERLIEICKKLGADGYVAGKGGRNYVNLAQWSEGRVSIYWQEFKAESVVYPQMGQSFVPGLSIIDCIFNIGLESTRSLIVNAWKLAI